MIQQCINSLLETAVQLQLLPIHFRDLLNNAPNRFQGLRAALNQLQHIFTQITPINLRLDHLLTRLNAINNSQEGQLEYEQQRIV